MSTPAATSAAPSLDVQRVEFAHRRFLNMPLAGTIAWIVVGIGGALLPPLQAMLVLFIATGSIVYLAMLLPRFTGEPFFNRGGRRNAFDGLFMRTVGMSLLVYAIAIPFAVRDHSAAPLAVGVLAGLMWLPFSWIVQHWIGTFHAIARTLLVLGAWLAFPEHRYVAVPVAIVAVYVVTILVLEARWRRLSRSATPVRPAA